jgi:hypothetical protein
MPIWYSVRSTLIDMNSKYSNILSSMVNEGLIGSTYSLSNLSLPSTCWLTSGLTSLVIGCTTNGVVGILLLVLISTYTKLGGFILEIRKSGLIDLQLKLITLFIQTS